MRKPTKPAAILLRLLSVLGISFLGLALPAVAADAPAVPDTNISRAATDLPGPLAKGAPRHHKIEIETTEVVGRLSEGTAYEYWTFGGKVPGPFLRVRVGDTVDMTLKNAKDSKLVHSIDLHAVTGPGGGAVATQTAPGEAKGFFFKAINAGLYVYHCATHSIPQHISNGMYGLILVEPAKGLSKVDREFYVMQGELYTEQPNGTKGVLDFSGDKLAAEHFEYVTYNGVDGLENVLKGKPIMNAKVGETVRIFFGVGGPNTTSALHLIGEIFDRVYDQAATSAPLTDVQTTLVPPGGATIVEFKLEVPGNYLLLDHALSRLYKGGVAVLHVDGNPNPAIYKGALTGGGH